MRTIVITEGDSDRGLLTRALEAVGLATDYRVISAGPRSEAVSIARTLLASTTEPVALVLDSAMHDTQQENEILRDLLASVGRPERFTIVLVQPAGAEAGRPQTAISDEALKPLIDFIQRNCAA